MDIFESCRNVNDLLESGETVAARNELIQLLDYHEKSHLEYSPLVNHLVRNTGLYPYLQIKTAQWQERFIFSAFHIRTGGKHRATLHREQAILLTRLLRGDNIAVSAPTSFGKSFVIDAYIEYQQPRNVMILVPTIALTDETRRRLYKKFAKHYNFITTADAEVETRNIFIFPAERAINYLDKTPELDLLVVDEFYKASALFDKDRAPDLLRAILSLSTKAKQRYFLAPNISNLRDSIFTKDMDFVNMLDAHTVFLKRHDVYLEIQNEKEKGEALLRILSEKNAKSLIYAGTYTEIDKVSNLLVDAIEPSTKRLVNAFADWLTENYEANWQLTNLVRRGTGIHNGRLHRSLSQLQIRLFEEDDGFDNIISTSSIIEGVNTSAENVFIWRNKNGTTNLNDFTYKNIIGRGGRMFRHFVGHVYLLERPPDESPAELELPFPDEMLGHVNEETYKEVLTDSQIKTIIDFKQGMYELVAKDEFDELLRKNILRLSNAPFIQKLAADMKYSPDEWTGLGFLNSPDPNRWERSLYKILRIRNVADAPFRRFVEFVKVLSQNWNKSIGELLYELDEVEVSIDTFFQLERNAAFRLSSLLSDVNELQKLILRKPVDISRFIFTLSHAFLPPVVYQLEEYGLPRMIAKKIQRLGIIDFENPNLTIHSAISEFLRIGKDSLHSMNNLNNFDHYIVDFFYEGITPEPSSGRPNESPRGRIR